MRRPALRGHRSADRRRRAADRRVRRRARPRRRHAPARDRRDPRGDGARPARQARPRRPHRDVHRLGRRPRRGGRHHRRPQGAQPGQARDRVPDGHQAALRLRRRQPDGRDAAGRLHQRHARHPLVQPDGRDQLGDRGRPQRAGRRRFDRPPAVQRRRRPDGLHPRRRARDRGPGDHRPAVDGARRAVADRLLAPGGRRRGHDPGARADRRDGVGRRRAVRQEHARAGRWP